MSRARGRQDEIKRREEGFNTSFCTNRTSKSALTEYNALHDAHMRHYFENPVVQKHLYRTGQIDRSGRVIDLDKNKAKLHIIEQEFSAAQKLEETRLREEEEMRMRVQQKRFAVLEKARADDSLRKMKEDKALRKEIMRAYHESRGVTHTPTRGDPRGKTPNKESLRSSKRSLKKSGSRSLRSASRSDLHAGGLSQGNFFVTDMAGTGPAHGVADPSAFAYSGEGGAGDADALDRFVDSR
mmetsp:Transcript_1369/g.2218  ORF Transcript_1369/g.2218 Transcript_1369/m.2218 type:complete len:240 (-) Transcript_1369:24-743(-)